MLRARSFGHLNHELNSENMNWKFVINVVQIVFTFQFFRRFFLFKIFIIYNFNKFQVFMRSLGYFGWCGAHCLYRFRSVNVLPSPECGHMAFYGMSRLCVRDKQEMLNE